MADPLHSVDLVGNARAVLRPVLIAMMLGLVLILVAGRLTVSVTTGELMAPTALIIATAAALYFLKVGRVTAAAHVMVAALLCSGLIGSLEYGSLRSVTNVSFSSAVVVAGVFLGRRAVIGTMILTSTLIGALVYGETTGALTALRRPVGWINWFVFSIALALIGLVVHYAHTVALEAQERLQQELAERVAAEATIRLADERLRLAMEVTRQGWFDLDIPSGRVVASEQYARLIGGDATRQDMTQQSWMESIHADDRAAVLAAFHECLTTGETRQMDYRLRTRTSPPVWLWVRSIARVVEWDDQHRPLRMTGTHADLSEHMRATDALRESEMRYRTLFEQSGDKILLLELVPNGPPVIRDANPTALKTLGYARDELVGAPVSILEPDVSADTTRQRARHALVDGSLFFETRHHRKDGSVFDAEVRATEFVMQGTRMAITTERDITARKRDEAALRSEAERLARVLEATSGGTWDWNIPSGASVFSPRYSSMLGYTPEEFAEAYTDWKLLVHPDDFDRVHQAHTDHFHHNTEFSIEYRMLAKSGAWHWIHSRGILIERDAQGSPVRMVGTHTDINDRKQAELALREREQRLREAQRVARVGSWEVDFATEVTTWSESLYRLAHLEPGTPLPGLKEPPRYFTPESWERVRAAMERTAQTGADFDVDVEWIRDDGSSVFLSGRGEAVRSPSGDVAGIRGTALDITDRLRAEAERAKLEAELRQAQKMESVGRLAGGVAHDFNNMLGVIIGVAELGMSQLDPGHPLRDDFAEIHDAARRSADLTRQLLTFARKQAVAPSVLDLNDTVARSTRMLERLIGEQIRLEWRPGDGLWPVYMDASQVDQMLANLCVNAKDAIADVGTLGIATENCVIDDAFIATHDDAEPGDYVRLRVSDSGHGMSSDVIAHIFEPFFTTKGVGEGTGLGLATVYGAVRQNRGFIAVSSRIGQGTTFEIYLPRYQGASDLAPVAGPDAASGRGHETILVVEDEVSLLQLTTRALERSGYVVLTAGSPAKALELAAAHPGDIDLLLTDVVMPGMNGRSLARAICAQRPTTQWLFMSGFATDVIGGSGMLDDAERFIGKPFTVTALTAKVREVLDRA